MPHSMQGTRGQVRFRGKTSPKFRRQQFEAVREQYMRDLVAKAEVAKRLLNEERGKSLTVRVKEKVKGFAKKFFSRGVR